MWNKLYFEKLLIFLDKSTHFVVFTISGIVTSQHKHCRIPWKITEDGPELYTCTSSTAPSGETDEHLGNQWCATSVSDDLTYKEWDWCSGELECRCSEI